MSRPPTAADARTLLEHTSDGIVVLGEDETITLVNAQAERLFRRKAEAMLGIPFWTLAADARTAEAAETLERALTRGLAGRFEIFSPGLYAWHAVTVAPMDGGAMLFLRDVTDRMRLLRDEAVRHGISDVITSIPVAVSVTRGPEHRFEIVNERARELLDGRDVDGMTIANAFPELVAQGFVDLMDRVYRTGEPYRARAMPARFRRGADSELTDALFDVVYQPLRDLNGEITGILSVSVDVTEQVEARKQLEAMKGGGKSVRQAD